MRFNGMRHPTGATEDRAQFIHLTEIESRQERETSLSAEDIENASRHSMAQDWVALRGHLTLTNLGVLFTDFIVISVTFALLTFICVIAAMNGHEMDSRFSMFQDTLTTVRVVYLSHSLWNRKLKVSSLVLSSP